MDLKQYIRDVPDFPKQGILFKDITTLLKVPEAFGYVINVLAERYAPRGIAKVVGVESRGFIFAGALAPAIGAGFVPVRKPGKLPAKTRSQSYELEYGTDSIEVHEDAISEGEKILVLDDVIATGGTLAAACSLVESLGGRIDEVATVVELSFLPGREKLGGRPFHSLIVY